MPMEPVWLQSICAHHSQRCGRCGSDHVRELDPADSSLDWLICNDCLHVWGTTGSATLGPGFFAQHTPSGKVVTLVVPRHVPRLRLSMLFAKASATLSEATHRIVSRLWRERTSRSSVADTGSARLSVQIPKPVFRSSLRPMEDVDGEPKRHPPHALRFR